MNFRDTLFTGRISDECIARSETLCRMRSEIKQQLQSAVPGVFSAFMREQVLDCFRMEEKLMTDTLYPDYEMQFRSHQYFLNTFLRFSPGADQALLWLDRHKESDMVFHVYLMKTKDLYSFSRTGNSEYSAPDHVLLNSKICLS